MFSYTAVCDCLHVQARRDLHAQEDISNLSKSKQMSWLSVQLSGISKRYMAMPYIVFSLLYPYVLRNYLKKSGVLL